ncbi:imidazole glycerol phosphate synthase subunit HisH [Chlorobium ferrooxidans]|uniref:Imidazole glycerol phosphate synthase subunit HisH n=1 Tax=Chlorobium ferrooxidans DSM 13031 TaxID=377431 RepID=Q0YS13_9CHLB|nr:imidazole glycerol phosphate synthase subunit HisH [Chlorobium ferrooxidans]EAT59060.1 imidazole glycerol phosphate synthase, glutamine amidotransferase subunit [Chlorobium ferrooxidans DSM 13031]
MLFIADYGAGNLRSVQKAFDFLGVRAMVSSDPCKLAGCSKVVLPGVGAFGQAIETLNRSGFSEAILEHVDKGGQLLGICLGMQLLLSDSEEMGAYRGLNLVPGRVLHFRSETDKIPQIGWNSVDQQKESVLFRGVADHAFFYFVHSFYCEPHSTDAIAATTWYAGKNFCSAIEKNGIFAVQFHPEKSSDAGLQVLKNFAEC